MELLGREKRGRPKGRSMELVKEDVGDRERLQALVMEADDPLWRPVQGPVKSEED